VTALQIIWLVVAAFPDFRVIFLVIWSTEHLSFCVSNAH